MAVRRMVPVLLIVPALVISAVLAVSFAFASPKPVPASSSQVVGYGRGCEDDSDVATPPHENNQCRDQDGNADP